MRLKYYLQCIVFLLLMNVASAQLDSFKINIVQDKLAVPVEEGAVLLSKSAFQIQVVLNGVEGVYCYASFKDTIFKVTSAESILGFAEIPSMTMAEESFNKDKELIVSDDGWAYWFYDSTQDWHRFDKDILVEGKKVTGTKSIKQFFFPEKKKSVPVKDVPGPLYLFFVTATQGKDFNLEKEIQRYKIKINWK